jgi:hypothetical protein
VRLVEHENAVLGQLLGDVIGNFRINHILIRVDDNIGHAEDVSREEVRTPAARLGELPHAVEREHAVQRGRGATGALKLLIEITQFSSGARLAHPRRSEIVTLGVDRTREPLFAHTRMHTEIATRRETQHQELLSTRHAARLHVLDDDAAPRRAPCRFRRRCASSR